MACAQRDGDTATSDGGSGESSRLREFNMSALRLTQPELQEKLVQLQLSLNNNLSLCNVNPARAADRLLAMKYQINVYTACLNRRRWPSDHTKWLCTHIVTLPTVPAYFNHSYDSTTDSDWGYSD